MGPGGLQPVVKSVGPTHAPAVIRAAALHRLDIHDGFIAGPQTAAARGAVELFHVDLGSLEIEAGTLGKIPLVVDVFVLHEGEDVEHPTPTGGSRCLGTGFHPGVIALTDGSILRPELRSRRQVAQAGNVVVQCQGNLPDVVHARCSPPRLPGGLDGRQQQADKNADDGDHHQQFDKRKTELSSSFHFGTSPERGSFNALLNAPGSARMTAARGCRCVANPFLLQRDY